MLKVRGSRYKIRSVPGVSGKARRLEGSKENTGRGRSGVKGAAPQGPDRLLQDFGLDLGMLPLWKWTCSCLDLKRIAQAAGWRVDCRGGMAEAGDQREAPVRG